MRVRFMCAAALALGLQVTGAHAQLTSSGLDCAAGSTFEQFEPTPLACSGAWEGNDASQQTSLMGQLELDFAGLLGDGASFAWLGKSDDAGSGPFVSNSTATSGTLTFDVAQTGLFAVSLKAGDAFSVYLFDGGDAGVQSINFSTLVGVQVNGNGFGAGLSHAALIGVSGAVTPPIPEPQTYALMLAGLGLVSFVAARRRRYS